MYLLGVASKRKEGDMTVTPAGHPSSRKTGEGRPVPSNPTRDAILDRIARRGDVLPHPDQRSTQGTKYISAYEARKGVAFAVDKMSGSKQPIWFLDIVPLRDALDTARIAYEVYPPARGRNSNLHKLPGFKEGSLIRAYSVSTEEAMRIIDMLPRD